MRWRLWESPNWTLLVNCFWWRSFFFFFPSGIPYSGLSFQMHATPHKLTPDERREAFKKHLTRVWIFKNLLDPKKNKKHNLITEGIVESTILVTNVSSDCKGLSASEAHCWVFQQTKAYQSLGGTSQWSHYETFQTKRTWDSGGNEGCRVDVREEKEIEQTVRGYRGESFVFSFFSSPQFCTLNLMDVGCHTLSDFVQGAMCHAVLELISFRTRGRREKKWVFCCFFRTPTPPLGCFENHTKPLTQTKI